MSPRRQQRQRANWRAAAAIGVALALVAGHPHGHHGHGTAIPASVTAIPAGGSYTPSSWAQAFLTGAGLPVTACNLNAITAWEAAEGGNWNNSARFNPIDTTQPEPGSWPMNSVGVQAYTSWASGLQATVTTLDNGNYPGIIAALRSGGNAQAVASAVAGSPWGTGPFSASC